jgi:hypothetical protein
MTASKLERLDGETSSIALRKNPPSVRIDCDVLDLPAVFLRCPPPVTPPGTADKAALKRALAAGVEIEGVRLERTTRLVRS